VKLRGLNALITGGSQGLGRTIAEEFLREGANIVFCARDKKTMETACAELQRTAGPGRKVRARVCDVSSEEQVDALVDFAMAELGSVQILVNNAGVYGPMGPTESVSLDDWRRALEINLYGVLLPCRALIPHFKKAGRGKIIILSGGGATNPLPNISAYAASKAAAVRLAETLAEELRAFRVDVNAVAPGPLNTRLHAEVLAAGPGAVGEAFYRKALDQEKTGGVPLEKGAQLCVYLASASSDGITGKLISAQWDPWPALEEHKEALDRSDIYTLRRIVPKDRGEAWGQ